MSYLYKIDMGTPYKSIKIRIRQHLVLIAVCYLSMPNSCFLPLKVLLHNFNFFRIIRLLKSIKTNYLSNFKLLKY